MSNSQEIITTKHLTVLIVILFSIVAGITLFLESPYNLIPFGLAGAIVFVYATFKHPMIGVYIYLIIFFFKPQEIFGYTLPVEKIIALTVIITLLLEIAVRIKKPKFYKLDIAYFAFLFVCFISIIFSPGDLIRAWDTFFNFFKVFWVYLFTSRIANSQKNLKRIVWLYIISIFFDAGYASYNYYSGNFIVRMGIERAEGGWEDPNSLANSIVLCLPFIYFLFKYYKHLLLRAILLIGVLICLWTIVITGSRGGMLGLVAAGLFLAYFSRYRIVTYMISIFLIIGLYFVMPEQYKDRLDSITDIEGTNSAAVSAQGRIEGLRKGLEFMMQRPVTGIGIGNFAWKNSTDYGIWLDAHNLLGKLAGELGLLGIITFTFFIYIIIKYLRYIKQIYIRKKWPHDFNFHLIYSINIALYLLFFQGITGHNLFRYNWYIFAAFIVIIYQLTQQKLEENYSEIKIDNASAKGISQ